ncbi:phospholipase D-like domain-containing protein DpdK [Actinomadura nitritigenes]|uniref:phospholipase D-like domain-containing protein DpdK n=1 Tax=Actinomadura nitritigenes TaxID=134602 RepID=UPI003D948296
MTDRERTLRTGSRMGLRADSILGTALLSELVHPGPVFWLVSSWITDVDVLDNGHGAFDALLGDDPPTTCRLSQILGLISSAGADVHVVTRPTPHNQTFIDRLRATVRSQRLRLTLDPKVHEKTLCGRDWMLSGSMNFTISGLGDNEESVTYRVGDPAVAQARLDFAARWKDQV